MTAEEIATKLTKHNDDIKSLEYRVKDLEDKHETLTELTLSVNKLAINMQYMADEQKAQGERLKSLEAEPAENAKYYKRQIIGCIISTVVGVVLGALLALVI